MGNIAKFGKKQIGFLAAVIMTVASMPSASAMSGATYDCSNSEGAAIIEDIKDRAGAIKISEVDDCIVLDAEALIISPEK